MAKKDSAVKVATGRGRRSAAKKPAAETVVEDKDQKAKETVENLLKDVPTSIKEGELLELDETPDEKSVEWLTEQLAALGEENEKLRKDAGDAKSNYEKIFEQYRKLKEGGASKETGDGELVPDSLIKRNVIALFDEVQRNMLGMNQTRVPYKNMSTRHLVSKMLEYFTFLNEHRKF